MLFCKTYRLYLTSHIKLFYAYTGDWQNDVHTIAKFDRTKIIIDSFGLYGDVSIKYLDSAGIKKACDDAENQFHKAITIIDSMELNEAPDVKSSRVLLCSASDFVSLLLGEDGELRRTLFKDNVRDYQGATDINEEILNTLRSDPHNFCLLNNGITIVCKYCLRFGVQKCAEIVYLLYRKHHSLTIDALNHNCYDFVHNGE